MESPLKLIERYRQIMLELHQLLTKTRDLLVSTESEKALAIMNEVQKRIDDFSRLPVLRNETSVMPGYIRRDTIDEFLRLESLVRMLSVAVNVRLANVLHALRADFLSQEETPRSVSTPTVLREISITGVETLRVQYVQAVPCL